MAPLDLLHKLERYYNHKESDLPVITPRTAALLSILFTLIYVVPYYLSSSTRPSPVLNRDAPSVIRARIRTVTVACIVSSLATLYLLVITAKADPVESIRLLGWWPVNVADIVRCNLLVLLLFLGPLFEKIVVEREFGNFRRGRAVIETLSSWVGYRNYVAGPITEEVIFRSVIVSLHLLAKIPPSRIVFLTPLYFGIAHVHHLYEFTLTHPHTPMLPALLRSVFQFTYTTLFGWFAAFIYLRTGSIYSCIMIHMFCNWTGLPRFWGRVARSEIYGAAPVLLRGKDDIDGFTARGKGEALGMGWSIVYYILLASGAYSFYLAFWPLTESARALAVFNTSSPA